MAGIAQFVAQYSGSNAQFDPDYLVTEGLLDDFDSAIGLVDSVTSSTTLTPTITLIDDEQGDLDANLDGWLTVYTRVSGVFGKTPGFALDFTDFRDGIETPASPWGMVWRYRDDSDPGTGRPRAWSTFDNNSGSPSHTFSNNSAFTENEIEVAVKPRWRYIDTQRAIAYAAASGYAEQLDSADASHVFNTVTLTSGSQNSVTPTTLNQYGILLDDTSESPAGGEDKLNIVILLSQHSSEDQGNLAGWEFIYLYTDGVGTTADWLRQHTRLYIYDVNPAGRYYGKERWSEEQGGNEDTNRAWEGTGSEQVNAVKSAVSTDIDRVDVMLDWHGAYTLNGNGRTAEFGVFSGNDSAVTDFVARADAAVSGATVAALGTTTTVGTAEYYFRNTKSAQLSGTPEFPIAAPNYPSMDSMYDYVAEGYAEALKAMVDNSELTLSGGGTTVSVPASSISVSGFAPTVSVSANVDVDVPQGSLSVTGFAPSVNVSDAVEISVGTGSLTVNGLAPTVTVSDFVEVSVPTGSVSVTGLAPLVTIGDAQVVPVPAGAVNIQGYAPGISVTSNISVEIPAGTVEITTFAPNVGTDFSVTVPAGSASITGYEPTVVASVKTVICTLVDVNGNALPNLADLSYAWFDEPDPANLTEAVVKGITESTDGSGEIEVPVSSSTLTSGQTGLLILRSSDGVSLGAYNLAIQ